MDSLRDRLTAGITVAMKARDRAAVAALRAASARVANAEAVPVDTLPRAGAVEAAAVGAGAADVPRRELSEDDVVGLVRAEAVELRTAADQLTAAGQDARAGELRAQAAVLEDLLSG